MPTDVSPAQTAQEEYEESLAKLDAVPDDDEAKRERKSTSTELVEIAMQRYRFGVSSLGETYALPKSGSLVVSMLRGSKSSLRGMLAREYFRIHRKAAPQQALADALLVLDGIAQESEEVELHLRVARQGEDVWIDMADQTGRAIRVTPEGWGVESRPPMLFKRTVLNSALPDPEPGGSLDELWRWLNVMEADRPLVVAWLIAALFDDIPHPVLSLQGEQGTAKSTGQRIVVSIIDPTPVASRKPPRDAESWVTAAAGSWIVGLDNLSHVPDWLSDSICRAVTGDGDIRRKLYTDGEHAIFSYRRAVCLTSIDLGALRGDLAERMIPITLEPIPEGKRLKESDVQRAWDEAHPRVLGAILDVAARVVRALPSVELARSPRMADFAAVLAAVDEVMGTDGFSRYMASQGMMDRDALSADPFIVALENLGEFEGTSAELHRELTPDKPPQGWPKGGRAVTTILHRQAPAMRRTGWTVAHDSAENKRNVLRWTLAAPNRPEKPCKTTSPSSPTSPEQPQAREARVARDDCRPSTYDEADALIDAAREGTSLSRQQAQELLSHDLNDLLAGTLTVEAARHYLEHCA